MGERAEGEVHFVAALMAADFFLADGWDVKFWGRATPAPNLTVLVRQSEADLAEITVIMAEGRLQLGHRWLYVCVDRWGHGGHICDLPLLGTLGRWCGNSLGT